MIADDQTGLRAAARRAFPATRQWCRIPEMRNVLALAPAKRRRAVAAMPNTIFAQQTTAAAEAFRGIVADALGKKRPSWLP